MNARKHMEKKVKIQNKIYVIEGDDWDDADRMFSSINDLLDYHGNDAEGEKVGVYQLVDTGKIISKHTFVSDRKKK